ncbi:uncharacterized protein LOC110986750 [Acanthaster planci]|uniref:Uncharacterized protein LOC110986750 n=1 Tax=Acanthaster planci TaxID=133434 RepID=A0A8B7ZIA5_ACAPL|nr:uncharacterized protein LOC110986750 [Acanthaster planci]
MASLSSSCASTSTPNPKTTKRPRSTNWTYEEVRILSAFVREHTNKLFGTSHKGTEGFEEEKQKCWKMAAENPRASGGEARDWQRIRKKWQDVTCNARKYYRECHQTGGGEKPAYNKTLEVVLDALSPISKDGIIDKAEGETFPEELLNQVAEAVSHTCNGSENQVDGVGEVVILTEDICDPEPLKVRRISSTSEAAAKPLTSI